MRAALGLVEQLTLSPDTVTPADIDRVREVGVSDAAIRDAVYVSALFNTIDRLADAFEFHVPSEASFRRGAKFLLRQGYAIPAWASRLYRRLYRIPAPGPTAVAHPD